MSYVLPLPFNTNLVEDKDLGRGFSIEDNAENALKKPIYLGDQANTVTTTQTVAEPGKFTLIGDQKSLKTALNLIDELSLSYALISGGEFGKYLEKSAPTSNKLIFLYSSRIIEKITKLKLVESAKIVGGIEKVEDINDLRDDFGSFFIKKIEFGATLDLLISLQSEDEIIMKNLKDLFAGFIDLGDISKTLKESQTKVNTEISIRMAGAKNIVTSVSSLEEADKIIKSFEIDTSKIVPVRIEIAPIPATLAPKINFDQIKSQDYKTKYAQIGSGFWEIEQLISQLTSYKKQLSVAFEDEILSEYVQVLYAKVSQHLNKVKKLQVDNTNFIKDTVSNILSNPVPFSEAEVTQLKEIVGKLIGSVNTTTDKGTWFGPTIDGAPTYKGTYKYKNGNVYRGLFLNEKRNGKGEMTYPANNQDKLISVDGEWKDDEVYYPAIVKYVDTTIVDIKNLRQCIKWKEDHKTKTQVETVEVTNLSKVDEGEFIFRYRVFVDLISDVNFRAFFENMKANVDMKRGRYNFLFMGMTGTGKTTMIEYFLNVLTGQVHAPKSQRAQELEAKGTGNSKTQFVCRYEIEYTFEKTKLFSVTLIDTPGFADVGGLEKDGQHIKSILKTVGKIDRLDSVSYVVNGALTRKTLEPLKVLCNVFSVLPNEAFECVSTIITFCDNKNQASGVRNVLNEMLTGIKDRPALFMDNPWSQHLNNKNKELEEKEEGDDPSKLSGVDNTEDLQKKFEAKTSLVTNFIIEIIKSKKSFEPKGMSALNELKDTLLSKLSDLAVTINRLSAILSLMKDLSDDKIQKLIDKTKNISLEEWVKDKGYAMIDGKPKAKIMGNEPFSGGVHSTVCFAPECQNMVCHQGCLIQFTPEKGNNIFTGCNAFLGKNQCNVCQSHCSFKQHVHVQCQLKWIENDTVIDTYYAIKAGFKETKEKMEKNIQEEKELQEKYAKDLDEFRQLNKRFKDLAVLGDMFLILDSSKRTYEQQHQIAVQAKDTEKADKLHEILKTLQSFIDALKSSESGDNNLNKEIGEIKARSDEKVSILNKILNGATNLANKIFS